jgi:hypothetical protein
MEGGGGITGAAWADVSTFLCPPFGAALGAAPLGGGGREVATGGALLEADAALAVLAVLVFDRANFLAPKTALGFGREGARVAEGASVVEALEDAASAGCRTPRRLGGIVTGDL